MKLSKFLLLSLCFITVQSLSAKPIDSEKLFKGPTHSFVLLSPDGKYVSVHKRDKKKSLLLIIDMKLNKVSSSIAVGSSNKLDTIVWLSTTQLYVSVKQVSGSTVHYIGSVKDGIISAKKIKASGYLVNVMPGHLDKVLFARKMSGRYTDYYDLHIVDIESLVSDDFSQSQKIKHNSKNVYDYTFDDVNNRVITHEYDSKAKKIIFKAIPMGEGRSEVVLDLSEADYNLKSLHFIGGNRAAVITNKNSDKMVLRKFDIKSQTMGDVIFEHSKYDLLGAVFLKSGEVDYVEYLEYGLIKRRYFDKGKSEFARRLSKTFSNQGVYITGRTYDGNTHLVYVEGADEPGEYYVYDKEKDRATRLFESYAELEGMKFSPSKSMKVQVSDDVEIEAFLTEPHDLDHKVLLVMPHGGPIGVQEDDYFNKEVQYYVSRGFSVLRVNFRGSAGFGKTFSEKGVGEFGKLIEEDITAAVLQVRKKHKFKHMCSMGASYGGYSAAILAIKHPDQYDCVVAAFGVYDLPLLFNESNYRSGKEYRKIIARSVGDFNEGLVDVSPVYLYEKLKAPILLIAGREDDVADFEHSSRFNYVLERNGHPVVAVFYKKTGHGHDMWSGVRHEAAITYDFLMSTLGLTMPEPEKLDQIDKGIIAEELVRIADGYAFGKVIDQDKKKAIQYNKRAASYGQSRANFNLGSNYHRGEQVELNLGKAVEYYEKSAELGYHNAYARLGRMYMEGEHLKQDWQKAHQNLEKAYGLKDSAFNRHRLARFYCLAPNALKNIDECIKLLTKKKHSQQFNETFSWIVAEAELTPVEYERLKVLLMRAYRLDHSELKLENVKEGTFRFVESEAFKGRGKHEILVVGCDVEVIDDKNVKFGIVFDVDFPGLTDKDDKSGISVRWIKKTKDGRVRHVQSEVLHGKESGDWQVLQSLSGIDESATWTLEVYDLNQKLLYRKQYFVTMPDKS